MRFLSDREIEQLLSPTLAVEAIERGFVALATGQAAVQTRVRLATPAGKLSTVGAILDEERLAGAKVYPTTNAGQFGFVVLLFELEEGRLLAVLEGGVLTRLRTAATSVVAAKRMARPDSSVLTLFGSGAQAGAHAGALADAFPLEEIRVVHHREAGEFVVEVGEATGVKTRQIESPAVGLHDAQLVVTATRSTSPVFDGRDLEPGAHVTAVGATQPGWREIDSTTVERADLIVVESFEQAQREAGDLLMAANDGAFNWDKTVELADLIVGRAAGRTSKEQITLFESIGIGLEDVAAAAAAYRRAVEVGAGFELWSPS
jgi:ornithine cyclodeaminase